MPAIEYRAVSKSFGETLGLDDVSLTIEKGRFTVLCGPPKSGKSTLLRMLVGLEKPDSGRIFADGVDITDRPPSGRNFGYVPQSFALYPHLSVFENIAYPLRLARARSDEVARRVDRAARMLSIGPLMQNTPDQLSGGEKQRVAVARGLLMNASVFVLDDPLAGLDYKLRERLMDELKQLCEDLETTFFYATSDSLEALTMAQSLIVLDDGRLIETADVLSLYREPQHVRSVELIGFPKANVWDGSLREGIVEAGPLRFAAPPGLADGPVRLGIRPEDVCLGDAKDLKAAGDVRIVEHLGSEIVVYLDIGGQPVTSAFPASGAAAPEIDSSVDLSIDPGRIMIFEAVSGRRLGRGRSGAGAGQHG